jgi:hypothetical protein
MKQKNKKASVAVSQVFVFYTFSKQNNTNDMFKKLSANKLLQFLLSDHFTPKQNSGLGQHQLLFCIKKLSKELIAAKF